jgi:4-amino-4-deoxy-L-arabinose transferase-like glycosyltransferase
VTGFFDCLVAFVVAGMLNIVIASRIRKTLSVPVGAFVLRVYWWTLTLRFVLALVLNIFAESSAFASLFWGDSNTYDAGGFGLALVWRGDAIGTTPIGADVVGRYGYYYFVGAVYYLFGRNQLLVQFLNGTIGAVTVVVLHSIAMRLFGETVARRAALLTAYFPGMVFWSAGMYKDPAILLCIVTAMYAVVRLRESLQLGSILLFMASVLALVTMRFYIAYFVVFATLTSFVFSRRGSIVQRVVSYGLIVSALVFAFTVVLREEAIEQSSLMTLERLQSTRLDQATLGQSAFGREYDVSTPSGALLALPVGLTYLLLAPFPWAIAGTRQALVLPEMLVWYGLIPAFVSGLRVSIRRQLGDVLPILVFAVSLTLAYALMQGNIGTAYRQRTQVTVFFFLFIAVGLTERAERKAQRSARRGLKPVMSR